MKTVITLEIEEKDEDIASTLEGGDPECGLYPRFGIQVMDAIIAQFKHQWRNGGFVLSAIIKAAILDTDWSSAELDDGYWDLQHGFKRCAFCDKRIQLTLGNNGTISLPLYTNPAILEHVKTCEERKKYESRRCC